MKIYMPSDAFLIELPNNLPQIAPNVSLVHHTMWKDFGRPGDICITDQFEPSEVIEFIVNNQCGAVLQRNSAWFAADFESCLYVHSGQERFFEDPIRSTLTKVQKSMCWEFSKKEHKVGLKENLLAQIEAGSRGLQESTVTVFEELFMNAMIDAPKASLEQNLESAPYEKRRAARLYFGVERGRLCLACDDPYGTLDIDIFLRRMHEVYSKGAGQVINLKSEVGGAGLGCVLLFEQCGSMYIGVKKNQATVVACILPTDLNHQRKDSIRKSLHIIGL